MNAPLEELASLYVLDQLEARERADFEATLRRDPRLAALVRELEAALARRIRDLPQVEPPAGMLARIEESLDQLPFPEAAPVQPALASWMPLARWGIAALIALSLSAVAIQYLRRGSVAPDRPVVIFAGLDSHQSRLAELPWPKRSPDADASFVQLASLAEEYWEKPADQPVTLPASGPGGRGYALFDPGSNQGFIAVRQLPAIEPGQRYHLWIVDTGSGRIREAGVLPVTDSHNGLYFFSVAPGDAAKSDRLGFFVTIEDATASGPSQPHGRVVLGEKRI